MEQTLQTLSILGYVFFGLSAIFLITAVAMFFGFRVPELVRDMSGSLEKKQIEEIRRNSSAAASKRGKVNVFEELEKKAKVKKNNTHSLNVGPTTGFQKSSGGDIGTSVLNGNSKSVNPDFIIEKNIMFVSTDEVI